MNKRILYFDVVKGFAMLAVMVGHCILACYGQEYRDFQLYWDNRIFHLVCTFHMPLFVLVSGYFAYFSMSKETKLYPAFIKLLKRLFLILFPTVLWACFDLIYRYFVNNTGILFPGINIFWIMVYTTLWYFWAVAVCHLVIWTGHHLLKDSWIYYLVLFISSFIIPDDGNLHMYKFLLPYFAAGFYFNKHKERIMNHKLWKRFYVDNKLFSLIALFIIYAGLFKFYRRDVLIYLTKYRILDSDSPLRMLGTDIFRMVTGFVGCVFFLLLLDIILKKTKTLFIWKGIALLGIHSYGLYVVQAYVIFLLMTRYIDKMTPSVFTVAGAVVFLAIVSTLIVIIISKIPILKLMVGKKPL